MIDIQELVDIELEFEEMFKKNKDTGVVINTETFDGYKRQRESMKATMRAQRELKETKSKHAQTQSELQELRQEIADLKSLFQKFIKVDN